MSKETPSGHDHLASVRVAVSGTSGFLGGVIAREASSRGCEVLAWTRNGVLPRFPSACGRHHTWENSPEILAAHIREFKPHCVVHGAGSASVASSLNDPFCDLQASFGSWSVLLEAVRLSGERPLVIFPSSAAVYGNPSSLPVQEKAPLLPISPYGMHKKLCEDLGSSYHRHFAVPVVILRLFSVFGPSQRRLLLHELFERCSSAAESLVIAGTGNESRDFLSEWCVADAVLAIAQQSQSLKTQLSPAQALNLASGEERSVLDVAHHLRDLVCPGRPVKCLGEDRPGNPLRWHADITALRDLIPAWSPLSFKRALEKTVNAWRA